MKGTSILLVEDEQNLGLTLKEYLEDQGHQVCWTQNAQSAAKSFSELPPKIVLLDIGLPDGDGRELAREWRRLRKDFVLLFLSAYNDPEVKLEGLEIGADDYITKPFALKELMLRLERIVSSNQELLNAPEEISIGGLKIWFSRYEIQDAHGSIIPLGQKENSILKLLWEKKGQVINRNDIINFAWGENQFPSQRTVDNYIVKLRKWVETDPSQKLEITSVRGVGYKLEVKEK